MRVLHVSSEVAPFAQSGGLADVVAGLPAAQAELGLDAAVLVPLYKGVAKRVADAGYTLGDEIPLPLVVGVRPIPAWLRIAKIGRVRYGFLDAPSLYDRDGTLYGPGGPAEFPDNHVRFGALGKAALAAAAHLFPGGALDVLHAHDWQGGPASIYAHLANAPVAIITTIHNLAYRGIFPKTAMDELGIPWTLFTAGGIEFYDQISFLKGGMGVSHAVTTVSPSYAHEILTPDRGEALDGFLRWNVKRLVGIVNGIDTLFWDPATDAALASHFSRDKLDGKARCRVALAAEVGLPLPVDEPLIGVIARMTGQKGLDLVAEIVPELARIGTRLVVLGAGEPEYEARFRWLAETFDSHVSTTIGFDVGFARRIYAGTDLFLMPSRFEPCGLGQLYAMRYGSIPIVNSVGGLRDTVIDIAEAELAALRASAAVLHREPSVPLRPVVHGTGFRFDRATPAALLGAIERAVALYHDRVAFASLQRAAMARDSSWTSPAHEYVQLYRSLRA